MKKILLMAFSTVMLLQLASCGGNEEKTQAPVEEKKPEAADMFKDDYPAYDATAIDAAAPVIDVNLTAEGNTMPEMKYNTSEIKVKSGSTIKLTFKNNSTDASMPHNWVLVHDGTVEAVATAGITMGKEKAYIPDSKDVLVHTKLLAPGEEVTISFPAPPAGKYQFVCTYPGHWSTMHGDFIVE